MNIYELEKQATPGLNAQRKSGYRSREMCRHIRAAFNKPNDRVERLPTREGESK